MAKHKLSSIVKRSLTSLVLLPLSIWVILSGAPYINMAILAVGAVLAWEWVNMTPNKRPDVYGISYIVALAVVCFSMSLPHMVAVVMAMTLFVWFKARKEKHNRLLTLGVPYITIGLGSLVWMNNTAGSEFLLWFFIAVWCMDIGGYVVGCSVKGPKLAPKISPNKTWSGLFGGMLLAAVVSYVFYALLGKNGSAMALFALLVAFVSQVGDLVESSIKRYLRIKDTSDVIPGHGGVFDRIDGLIFAAPFVVICFKLFNF